MESDESLTTQQIAGPNDEERDLTMVAFWARSSRSSSSVSFALGANHAQT